MIANHYLQKLVFKKKKACEIKWDLPSMTCPAQHALKCELHKCKHKLQFITLELNKVFFEIITRCGAF